MRWQRDLGKSYGMKTFASTHIVSRVGPLLLGLQFLAPYGATAAGSAFYGDPPDATHPWAVHDRNRPQPPVVTPGRDAGAPSDAIVLFDGTNLNAWESVRDGKVGPAGWKVANGYMEVVKGKGTIRTKDQFGDCQLHMEWASPEQVSGNSQGRGNSGIFFVGDCEVQVLDIYKNPSYADGMAGSIYGIHPPMVNALHPPGEFNVYDVVFRRPIFRNGEEIDPGRVTVFCNGILVQDSATLEGSGGHRKRSTPRPFPEKGPISLQDHGNPVRFRNIWLRELPPRISEGGTDGGRLTEEETRSLRAETAASIREKAAEADGDVARMMLLLESLVYRQDAESEGEARDLLEDLLEDLGDASGEDLEQMKSKAVETRRALAYLAQHKIFEAPAQKAALDKLVVRQGWAKK